MSDSAPERPAGDLPPEVPDEFAAAYRAAYEAAMAAQSVPLEQGDHAEHGLDEAGLPRRVRRIAIGTHRDVPVPDEEYDDDDPSVFDRVRDSGLLVPVLLVVLALLLVSGAYVAGRAFSGRVAGPGGETEEPRVVMSERGSSNQKQAVSQQQAAEGAWDGDIEPLDGVRASARCTSEPGEDGSGTQVTYVAAHLVDRAADTTWRCDGAAVGQKLTFDLGEDRDVVEVGLIPGYAKTDDADGTDRYAENNRVTRVRWTIGSTVVEQSMSGSPDDRSLRLLRVPRTTTDQVTLEILAVDKGTRDTTAISEVQLGQAA